MAGLGYKPSWCGYLPGILIWLLLYLHVSPVTWVESISQLHHGNSFLCYFYLSPCLVFPPFLFQLFKVYSSSWLFSTVFIYLHYSLGTPSTFTFLVPGDIFLYTVWSPLIQQIIGKNLHMLSGIQAPVNMDVSHGVYISVGAPVSSVHI